MSTTLLCPGQTLPAVWPPLLQASATTQERQQTGTWLLGFPWLGIPGIWDWGNPAQARGESLQLEREARPWGVTGSQGSQESQVLGATKPCSLVIVERACGLGSSRPRSGCTSLRCQGNRPGAVPVCENPHVHGDEHVRGREATPCPHTVTVLESLPHCSVTMAQATSNHMAVMRRALNGVLPSSSPQLPRAVFSIFLQGQGALSCASYLLCLSALGCLLWGAGFSGPGLAGPQPCQTCLLWALGALLFSVAQGKSGLPAQSGDRSTPGAAAQSPLAKTQGSPGPQASD